MLHSTIEQAAIALGASAAVALLPASALAIETPAIPVQACVTESCPPYR
jgi:hypothetical protein